MFVQSSIEIPFDLDAVRIEMLASVHVWLQPLIEEAIVEGRVLRADLIPTQAADRGALNLTIGSPWLGEMTASIPYRAWMDGDPWANFDGRLIAGWFGAGYTQLELDAHYYLPFTLKPRERLLVHRLAQVMNRRFLAKVALELSERVCAVRA